MSSTNSGTVELLLDPLIYNGGSETWRGSKKSVRALVNFAVRHMQLTVCALRLIKLVKHMDDGSMFQF